MHSNFQHENGNIAVKSHGLGNVHDDDAQEEDWSELMSAGLAGGSFAQHEVQQMLLPNQTTVSIASTACLSPLDMIDLSWGTHDATGHRIWMGAELWMEALPFLEPIFNYKKSASCRCLELGSGTGLAGISLLRYYKETMTFQLIFSDNSQSALDLCRFNCQQNGFDDSLAIQSSSVQFELLQWGSVLPKGIVLPLDVVFATDVIYDADAWSPLLQTARRSLHMDGYLIVSHVPRAALPKEWPTNGEQPQYQEALESFLLDKATIHGFSLKTTIRPNDLQYFKNQQEMEQAGAAIFIFQVTPRT